MKRADMNYIHTTSSLADMTESKSTNQPPRIRPSTSRLKPLFQNLIFGKCARYHENQVGKSDALVLERKQQGPAALEPIRRIVSQDSSTLDDWSFDIGIVAPSWRYQRPAAAGS